ncbi:NTP transferase domain-containing protein [Erythrobacter sp. YT30]|uniref:nucleotidyltransferase family protein n=1 Tax=Erythrobacter sp. YT30 TaxID=1735012 RepID=UPI00076CBD80|nr:nucleotidyltransferase family protein [Erythrobacter sp. YT30]KWV90813.1 hypothetical protein AUC45_05545 [Erythrobacter sp. YT30]
MPDEFRLAIALLAAGQSRRFGSADKLAAPLLGKKLGVHAAETLADVDAALRLVVVPRLDHPCSNEWRSLGFTPLANADAREGMGSSVRLAASHARKAEADALLIALADMPLIKAHHIKALIDAAKREGAKAIYASSDGRRKMPPACFGKDHFQALTKLQGDAGARAMLSDARAINCEPQTLMDIDDADSLAALEKKLKAV